MMKKVLLLSIIVSGKIFSQNIGIKTNNPSQALDVVGSVAIGNKVVVDTNTYVPNPQGFDIVATDPESSLINGKLVKVETLYTPLIIQPYNITNVYRDDVNSLNLGIPTDKYMIAITNFQAIPSTSNPSEPNDGVYSNTNNKGRFVIRAFEQSGKWYVQIGYPNHNTQYESGRYSYKFDVILFSRRFYKVLDESLTTYNLNGSVNGDAVTPPSGI